MINNDPVFEKCKGDSEPEAWPRDTLKEVVLRYEVQENGQTRHRTVRVDPQQCGGVLWTENATKDVTRFRFFSRLRRLCWRPGSGRPAWLTVFQSKQPMSATAGSTEEGPDSSGQTKAMMMMSASVTEEHSDEVELAADTGNCYYYKGQIICC